MILSTQDGAELRLDPERGMRLLDWREIFGRDGRVEIEIGIGKDGLGIARRCDADRGAAHEFTRIASDLVRTRHDYCRKIELRIRYDSS